MAREGERDLAPEGGAPLGLGGRVGPLDQSFQKLPGPAACLHFLLTGGLPGAWMVPFCEAQVPSYEAQVPSKGLAIVAKVLVTLGRGRLGPC